MKNTDSPHVYIVGRNASAAERIISECKALNADGRVEFLKGDVCELQEVDRICAEILKKETKLNLLVQSQGNLNLRGRDGSCPSISNAPYSTSAHCDEKVLYLTILETRKCGRTGQEVHAELLLPHTLHDEAPPDPANRIDNGTTFLALTVHPRRGP